MRECPNDLFLALYTKYIVILVRSNIKLLAEDNTLYLYIENPITDAETINTNLLSISQWSNGWLCRVQWLTDI